MKRYNPTKRPQPYESFIKVKRYAKLDRKRPIDENEGNFQSCM
nr:MAG TPA: hypothetical protein [Caudoviricetes sp.]